MLSNICNEWKFWNTVTYIISEIIKSYVNSGTNNFSENVQLYIYYKIFASLWKPWKIKINIPLKIAWVKNPNIVYFIFPAVFYSTWYMLSFLSFLIITSHLSALKIENTRYLLISSLPGKALRMLLEARVFQSHLTCFLKAEPDKLDIKNAKPLLYLSVYKLVHSTK